MVMSQISILERISLGRTIQCLLLIRVVNIKSVLQLTKQVTFKQLNASPYLQNESPMPMIRDNFSQRIDHYTLLVEFQTHNCIYKAMPASMQA